VSLFPAATRITDMMLGAAIFGGSHNNSATAIWEAGVGLDTEIAQLRRGDLDALSTLLTRYQNRLYRYLLRMVRVAVHPGAQPGHRSSAPAASRKSG
jgi:hypothetical protein